jgi:DNA polymerase III epsilon subunit family exonuclease
VRPGFAVVDVETTGFVASRERIVEIAVVVVEEDGSESEAFCTLLDPGRDPGPTHVHGITAAMVEGAPAFAAIHAYLATLLSGRVLVGHNVAGFDLGFLRAECLRCGVDDVRPEELALIDTLTVARDLLGLYGRASLSDCCSRFGLTWDDHHSALGDARITAALFAAMRNELGDEALDVGACLARAGATRWPAPGPPVLVGVGAETGERLGHAERTEAGVMAEGIADLTVGVERPMVRVRPGPAAVPLEAGVAFQIQLPLFGSETEPVA